MDGGKSLLPIHNLVTPTFVRFNYEWLQTVERLSIAALAILDKFPNVI